MRQKIVFRLTIASLAVAGAWGISLISENEPEGSHKNSNTNTIVRQNQDTQDSKPQESLPPVVLSNTADTPLLQIEKLIENGLGSMAAESVNTHYSEFSSSDLAKIKLLFLQQQRLYIQAENYQSAQRVLIEASTAIDDIDIWKNLAAVSIQLDDWQTALKAQLKSAGLEIDPQQLESTLLSIVGTASQLRAKYERIDDEISIRDLYQRLHDSHPTFSRFQLELAQSHLRLDNPELAVPLLEQLQYDADLSQLAKQKLAALERAERQSNTPNEEASALSRPERNRGSDIVVPLRRVGNSFLVNTSINGRSLPLLLDTGASITALSTDLIRRLNLEPTGRSIRLNTANGSTQANLYKSKKITLGQLSVSDLIVAEIDLGRNSGFQGLLGTDLLNRINTRYSYLIDNQQNALIFRRR